MEPIPKLAQSVAPKSSQSVPGVIVDMSDPFEIGRAIKETRRSVAYMAPFARDLAQHGATRRSPSPGALDLSSLVHTILAGRKRCRSLVLARTQILEQNLREEAPRNRSGERA